MNAWLMKGYLIPFQSLFDESAKLDGAGHFRRASGKSSFLWFVQWLLYKHFGHSWVHLRLVSYLASSPSG